MYNGEQNTISYKVNLFGKPENSDKFVNAVFLPAPVDTGITIKRVDTNEEIKINFDTIYIENMSIHTKIVKNIENVLVSLWACKIDNVVIEVDGDSMPHIDGSSEPISFILTTAGKTSNQQKTRKVFEITKTIKTANITVKPIQGFIIKTPKFEFNNKIHPYKDWLSFVNKKHERYLNVFIIALLYVSGHFSLLEFIIKNYNQEEILETIKNIFLNG
jgi:UDP-3-O-acyl-N-acetylglucosamine deacetylase